MMRNKNFAIFILTFGRHDRVFTMETLRKMGYTGKIYLVCSTDDKQLPLYQEKYGDDVLVFDKDEMRGSFDMADNFPEQNSVIFARNINNKFAKELGLTHYCQMDDDYTHFQYKIPTNKALRSPSVRNFDGIFDAYIDALISMPSVQSLAFAQGGDLIGGKDNPMFWKPTDYRKRKLMNCYIRDVERDYQFFGRGNDDVNCYIVNQKTGMVFLTHPFVIMVQPLTQSNEGGLTDFYKEYGTYVKSFYTILYQPSAVSIKTMGRKHRRLHHSISWKHAIPCIIPEYFKKF